MEIVEKRILVVQVMTFSHLILSIEAMAMCFRLLLLKNESYVIRTKPLAVFYFYYVCSIIKPVVGINDGKK
jgi:hypothetical protein